jgi:hypothetical protein
MHRIGFRRTLPLLFTLVHVVLVWSTLVHPPKSIIVSGSSGYRSVAYQEGTSAQMERIESRPLDPAQKVSLIVNLPAMFLATIFAAVLFPRSDTAWMYISIVFVPLVWFVLGRWLDGVLGYSDRLQLSGTVRKLLAVPALGVFCVSIAGFTPLYHHRTADSYWVFTGSLAWSGFCVAIMLSSSARRTGA